MSLRALIAVLGAIVMVDSYQAAGVLNNGTLNALDSTFTNNTVFGANTQGGAIFNNGTLRVARCTFVNNAASTSGGGRTRASRGASCGRW